MRTVRRDGIPVHLRARSFTTLLCLIENRGTVVTKEILLDRFWKGTNVTENALVQSIKDIRQALGDDSKNPCYVRTVSKTGYTFIAAVEEHVSEAESDSAVRPPLAVAFQETAHNANLRARIFNSQGGIRRVLGARGMGLAAVLLALLATATTIGFVRSGPQCSETRAEAHCW